MAKDLILVTLTEDEMNSARVWGQQLHARATRRGWEDRVMPNENSHFHGRCGEIAVAKYTGLQLNMDINAFRDGGDVGGLEVRTPWSEVGKLIIRPADDDNKLFVLVVPWPKVPNTFRIVGCIFAADAKIDAWWGDPGKRGKPCWSVPQHELRDLAGTLEAWEA